jgi:hypothetical protein
MASTELTTVMTELREQGELNRREHALNRREHRLHRRALDAMLERTGVMFDANLDAMARLTTVLSEQVGAFREQGAAFQEQAAAFREQALAFREQAEELRDGRDERRALTQALLRVIDRMDRFDGGTSAA